MRATLAFSEKEAFAAIESGVGALIDAGKRPVSLGGDHSITYPIVKAFARRHPGLTIFHFDAHPDLYDEFEGNRLSHACPFARIMEAGLVKRLVQVGIRTMVRHQREQAEKFGVDVVEMRDLPAYAKLKATGPVYITFDMDVLDPAFAPGVSHREPGGMSVREAIAHLHAIEGEIVGADLVEFNPVQDVAGMTATVAAKILKEILGKMIAQYSGPTTRLTTEGTQDHRSKSRYRWGTISGHENLAVGWIVCFPRVRSGMWRGRDGFE